VCLWQRVASFTLWSLAELASLLGENMTCTRKEIVDFLIANKDSFRKDFSVKKIGIFGSYARDEATAESDIDVIVELEKADMFYLIGIKQILEEKFGCRADVVRLRVTMNPTLRRRIEKDAVFI
jgi:predicted nucleotidyltransferase